MILVAIVRRAAWEKELLTKAVLLTAAKRDVVRIPAGRAKMRRELIFKEGGVGSR